MAGWIRCTRLRKCPLCQHDSWCSWKLVENGNAIVHCMRSADVGGKLSAVGGRLVYMRAEFFGDHYEFYHLNKQLASKPVRVPIAKPTNKDDAVVDPAEIERLHSEYVSAAESRIMERLSSDTKLPVNALQRMQTGWTGTAWTFPMSDADYQIVGMRMRGVNGRKWSFTGGHEGLFVPSGFDDENRMHQICEGPTDCAALVAMGYNNVFGRPSCNGAVDITVKFTGRRDIIIWMDRDRPGIDGAEKLAAALAKIGARVRFAIPIIGKDIREWVLRGAAKGDIDKSIRVAFPYSRAPLGTLWLKLSGQIR